MSKARSGASFSRLIFSLACACALIALAAPLASAARPGDGGGAGKNQPPVVTITSPADGATTTATAVPVVYTVTDDSSKTPTCDRTSGSYYALSLGANTITVTCTDVKGLSATDSVTVTRNDPNVTGPTVEITSGPSGVTTDNTPTFTYKSANPVYKQVPCGTTTCIAIVYDASIYECQVDGGYWANCSGTSTTAPSYTTPSLPDGPHTFCVRTYGESGLQGPPTCRDFVVDAVTDPEPTPPPAPNVNCQPGGMLPGQYVCTWSEDTRYEYTCRVDNNPSVVCHSPWTTPQLGPGSHTISVCAADLAGNLSCSSRSFFVS